MENRAKGEQESSSSLGFREIDTKTFQILGWDIVEWVPRHICSPSMLEVVGCWGAQETWLESC